MLNRLVLTSAIALALAAPAWAQTTVTPTTPPNSSAAAPSAIQIDSSQLIGQSVRNEADNKTVGTIDSVIIDKSGKIHHVVIGVGGFLGIDRKDVAVDWSKLHVTDAGRKVTMNADKDELKAMPDYVWPKEQARGTVWTTDIGSSGMRPATTNSGSSGSSITPGTGTSTTPTTR
jgi:hypothetical protein